MKSGLLLLVVVAPILMGGSTTRAAKKPIVEIRVKTIIGKIMTLDAPAGKLTVRVKDLAENITLAPDCKFGSEEDGLNSLSELKDGEQVIVTCTDEQGRLLAHRITRLKPKKARATEPKPKPAR